MKTDWKDISRILNLASGYKKTESCEQLEKLEMLNFAPKFETQKEYKTIEI